MRGEEYWTKRLEAIEAQMHNTALAVSAEAEAEIQRVFTQIEQDILAWQTMFAGNNGIDATQAKQWLDNNQLAEFRWTVAEYIRHGEELEVSPAWIKQMKNSSAKWHITRLRAIQIRVRNSIEVLAARKNGILAAAVAEQYMKSAAAIVSVLNRGLGSSFDTSGINENLLKQVVTKPWTDDNVTFSDRIWRDKVKLNAELSEIFTDESIKGRLPGEYIDRIVKRFGVEKYKAKRLIMTEMSHFNAVAERDMFERNGVTKYRVKVINDDALCDVCKGYSPPPP